ncbi:MAG: AAA family ATPase [bacterium]|nr:AAA family ATPase [bacterium]
MRVCRLDLLRYGHFSNRSLEFPEGGHDFHIILGANEAGKSTSRNALEDALFGIPQRSTFGFRHGYRDMMVGALIEHEGRSLEFRRRKGKSNTLLDIDGQAIAPDALRFFLGGADRNFLERMFSLSHERLRKSGQELSDPRSETAAMIFGAATGTEEIAIHIRAMKEEAGTLFTPRKTAGKPFYQLVDRLNDATAALGEATVTGDDWQRAGEEAHEARTALEDLRRQRADLHQARERLSRIQLVYPDLMRKKEVLATLAGLGDVQPFADDVLEVLDSAEREVSRHDAQLEQLEHQIAGERERVVSITIDGALPENAREITDLDQRRIQLQPEREDLPKRRRELADVEQRLRNRAGDLGLEDAEAWRMPAPHIVARLRELSDEWIRLGHVRDLARQQARDAGERARILDERLQEMGPEVDVGPLQAALEATDRSPDPQTAREIAEREHRELASRSETLIRPLLSLVGDVDRLAGLWAPPLERVQELRDGLKQAVDRLEDCRKELASVERNLAERQAQRESLIVAGEIVSAEEIEALRRTRDQRLETVRTCMISGRAGVASDPVGDLAEAIRQADEAADRRFSTARTVARLEEIASAMEGLEAGRATLGAERDEHDRRLCTLRDAWNDLLRDLPGDPLDPDAMVKWLNDRQVALQALEEERKAARTVAALAAAERQARDLLIAEAATLGMETHGLDARPFNVVRSLAAAHCDALKDRNRKRADLARDLEEARREEREKASVLAREEADLSSLGETWRTATEGIDVLESPDQAVDRLRIIEEMRGDMDRAAELGERRIGKIERDLEAFATRVGTLVETVAEDPGERDVDTIVRDLARRLSEELAKQDRLERMNESLAQRERELEEIRHAKREAEFTIRDLMARAGVESVGDLRREIARSNEAKRLKSEADRLTESLAKNGGGRSQRELEDEARDVDPDRLGAEIASISDTLQQLDEPIDKAALAEREAAAILESIGGGDAAIAAAWDRQAILAELEELSARYVRAQTGLRLLQWAVDRYRAEQQAPLLKRASTLFAILTQGSFSGLGLLYDEKDQAVLAGTRADGSEVDVTGMSDGTVDQLWLALRLAAIDGWLEGNSALPFIADDLFVNFDDERAGAGLGALHHLAGACQVLVFTHHAHLVGLARQVLGDHVSVVSLDAAAGPDQPDR